MPPLVYHISLLALLQQVGLDHRQRRVARDAEGLDLAGAEGRLDLPPHLGSAIVARVAVLCACVIRAIEAVVPGDSAADLSPKMRRRQRRSPVL